MIVAAGCYMCYTVVLVFSVLDSSCWLLHVVVATETSAGRDNQADTKNLN